jgi:VanZ family protein
MSCCRVWPTVHIVAFLAALAAWTVALLSPVPQESAREVLGGQFGVFLFAKTVHVGAYAVLTILGGTAPLFGRKWVWLLPALVSHGAVTEYFQQFVGRGSRVEDVALDALGIALGGLAVWAARRFSHSNRLARTSSLE